MYGIGRPFWIRLDKGSLSQNTRDTDMDGANGIDSRLSLPAIPAHDA
jgi:hypothetical protein